MTLNHFRYGSFIKGTDDFSGKNVPSVPCSVFSLLADVQTEAGFYLNASYYAASSIYMNDANSAKAEPYHLLGCKLGWNKKPKGPWRLNIYAGIDNLLDETYSLGNDINAAANRFYNAAPAQELLCRDLISMDETSDTEINHSIFYYGAGQAAFYYPFCK